MKAINILWDIDDEVVYLPMEIEIPEELRGDFDAISDYISDTTGFCHYGFEVEG